MRLDILFNAVEIIKKKVKKNILLARKIIGAVKIHKRVRKLQGLQS